MNPVQLDRLREQLTRLRLLKSRERLEALLQDAAAKDLSYADFLDQVLGEEVASKAAKNITMRTSLARFPFVKSLEVFDFAYQPSVDHKQIQQVASCHFIEHGENLVILGPPGVGKSHLAIGLGLKAIEHGYPWHQRLELSRTTAYYQPKPVSAAELALRRRIDELHLDYPFAGAADAAWSVAERRPYDRAQASAHCDGPHGPRRAAPQTHHQPAASGPSGVSVPAARFGHHTVEPGLGITYIPMQRGFVYLFAVLDWASRRVLAWRLSNTLTTDFCIEAVRKALATYGTPDIFNTDQGCQFTSLEFIGLLKDRRIQISMDGKGCWRDNVFVERLWKGIKYEEVYLYAYDSVSEAKRSVEKYVTFYNQQRPHRALDDKTPDEYYFDNLPALPNIA